MREGRGDKIFFHTFCQKHIEKVSIPHAYGHAHAHAHAHATRARFSRCICLCLLLFFAIYG